MAEYATAVGFIQFPVDTRDVNGQDVRDVTIRTPGQGAPLIRITVWPEFDSIELNEGDFIAVDGPFESRVVQGKDGSKKTYLNMSAKSLAVLAPATPKEREVVNKKGKF